MSIFKNNTNMALFVNNLTVLFRFKYCKIYSSVRYFSYKNCYRLLFFGNDSNAFKSFKKINENRKAGKLKLSLDLVVPANTKQETDIEKYAASESLRVRHWPLKDLCKSEYDSGIIVGFGHLIRDDMLNKFPLGIINVHPSLLPRWRGASPVFYTLLHGDQVTGTSLMKIKANVFDVGDIIDQRKVYVSKDIRLPELTEQLMDLGTDMLLDCLERFPESLSNAVPQKNEGVTYAKKINKSISEVRWTEMTALQVYNLYRATYGLFLLTTTFRDKKARLFDAFLHDTNTIEQNSRPVGSLAYCEETDSIKVLCSDKKYIHFKSMRIIGKKVISATDFNNGYIKNVPLDKRYSNLVCC